MLPAYTFVRVRVYCVCVCMCVLCVCVGGRVCDVCVMYVWGVCVCVFGEGADSPVLWPHFDFSRNFAKRRKNFMY